MKEFSSSPNKPGDNKKAGRKIIADAAAGKGGKDLESADGKYTAELKWIPDHFQEGIYDFKIIADDGDIINGSLKDEVKIVVKVKNKNYRPELSEVKNQVVYELETIEPIDIEDVVHSPTASIVSTAASLKGEAKKAEAA